MRVFYCKSWFRAKKRPTEIWPDEKARAAHAEKQTYTALIGDAERPYCFLDVSDRVVGVGFLDALLRESLTYAFQEITPGRLFLTMATHREFKDDTDEVAAASMYSFKPDGALQITRESFNPRSIETATSTCDVSGNYADVPGFGKFDDLIQVERG
jgi:hypothetical protein